MALGHKEQLVISAASWENVGFYAAIGSTAADAPFASSPAAAKVRLDLSADAGLVHPLLSPVLSNEDPSSHSSYVLWDEGSTGSADIGSPPTSSTSSEQKTSSGTCRGGIMCNGPAGGCLNQIAEPATGWERPAGLNTELLQLHEQFKSEAWAS